MNRSYLRVTVGTSISPYRGSTCYKRFGTHSKTFTWQAGIEKGTKRVYLPLQYSGMYHGPIYSSFSSKKKKEFRISPGPGEQIGVGKRERGGYEPSPVAVPGPPTPSFPFARPGEVRRDKISRTK
jgi:hypothetical protein